MREGEARVIEGLRLLEQTGDLEQCLDQYPDLSPVLRGHVAVNQVISAVDLPALPGPSQAASRGRLLSSLTQPPGGLLMLNHFVSRRAAAMAAAVTLFAVGAVGAGAATGSLTAPVNEVLDEIGVTDGNHGQNVSQKVHEAIEEGGSVSQAACEAAHDRETLPEGARAALEDKDKEPKDCSKEAEEEVADEESTDETAVDEAVEESEEDEAKNHGQSVSDAVHEAQEATPPGPERGRAVSEAACEAAHDRTTLPAKAKKTPPGQAGKEPKDCTHSNSEDESEE